MTPHKDRLAATEQYICVLKFLARINSFAELAPDFFGFDIKGQLVKLAKNHDLGATFRRTTVCRSKDFLKIVETDRRRNWKIVR